MSRDYWYWYGGKLRDGCGGEGGSFESWIVPGHRSGRLQSTGQVASDWQIWLPLMAARTKTLEEVSVNILALPESASVADVRCAIYESRGDRCAYPGALLRDLDDASRSSPGVAGFGSGLPLVLPGGRIYWVASWWRYATPVPLITTGTTAENGAYPLLAYDGPGDLLPRVGWAANVTYTGPGVTDWPDPAPGDLKSVTIGGQITAPPTTIGLPAVFLLFS